MRFQRLTLLALLAVLPGCTTHPDLQPDVLDVVRVLGVLAAVVALVVSWRTWRKPIRAWKHWPKVRHYAWEALTFCLAACAVLAAIALVALVVRLVWEALAFGWGLVG